MLLACCWHPNIHQLEQRKPHRLYAVVNVIKTLLVVVEMNVSIHLPDGDKVFERLGHLQAFHGQVASMQEVVDPLLAATAVVMGLRLCQLIVMVGETQVFTSAVDVHLATNDMACHCRALYVPACTQASASAV